MKAEKQSWLERPIHPALPAITNEIFLFAGLILLTVVTRFYDLETRVMSHDESLHTYFSWLLYRGQGYQHNPMMHGPLQFHLLALSYFLFGVSDFTARIPSVLFSIAIVWMVWYWRRYLGNKGALIAGLMLAISPYMLFYGRYVRNEAFAGLSGILMLYAVLRHLEVGGKCYLYLLALSLVIHFTAKETAFIYAAQLLLFLAIYFLGQVTNKPWAGGEARFRAFIIVLAVGILLFGGALGYGMYEHSTGTLTGSETAQPANPEMPLAPLGEQTNGVSTSTILVGAGLLFLIAAIILLIVGYTWKGLQSERSFDLLILTGTLTLPMLTPFPIKFLENWLRVTIPSTAADVTALLASQETLLGLPRDFAIIGIFLAIIFAISIALGLLWNREWWKPALLFWGIFTVFYTTIFTNTDGLFTGLIGSLGYWLAQQNVERGSQPWYYYIAIQIPVYEYLIAIGTLVAGYLGVRKLTSKPRPNPVDESESNTDLEPAPVIETDSLLTTDSVDANFANTFSLLLWWAITSIIALTLAGERMPWLTYHMAWPMALLTGWGIGHIIEKVDWSLLRPSRTALALLLIVLFLVGLFSSLTAFLGPTPPFQGRELASLQATGAFLLPAIVALASAAGLVYLMEEELAGLLKVALTILLLLSVISLIATALTLPTNADTATGEAMAGTIRIVGAALLTMASVAGLIYLRNEKSAFPSMTMLAFMGMLTMLTIRTSFRAAYINYDSASEYLVYAHAATGVKQVMAQAREISQRTTGGMNLKIAYDSSAPDTGVSWPFVWYLRDYTSQSSFDQPTRALRESVFVIVDAKNFDKIDQALGPGFYRFDYIRMWWPNQDYFSLTRERLAETLRNRNVLAGIWDIWFDRDYTRYAAATGHSDLTPTTWQPADQMRLYIRKDIAAQVWNYGAAAVETVDLTEPDLGKEIILAADLILDSTQAEPVNLSAPRSIAFAPDGTLYVADSRNHRIVHLDTTGKILHAWGSISPDCPYPSGPPQAVPNDTFCEPWGVAAGPDGSVYVSDTWNYRIVKFTADGKFITAWGTYGTDLPTAFYGPRGIAVDAEGRVYVADTGNKHIVLFDADGNYLTHFGGLGYDPGNFDEPVGVTVGQDGKVYVTDTWNKRIQSFIPSEDRMTFFPDRQWDLWYAWYGQSLENKPFVAVNADGHVFVTDPEAYRVIELTSDGEVVRTWGAFGNTQTTFGLTSGIAVDAEGHLWITDAFYNRILRFTLPEAGTSGVE